MSTSIVGSGSIPVTETLIPYFHFDSQADWLNSFFPNK